MLNVTENALRGSVAIIRKGDEDDPVSIVTKSLEDLTRSVDERLKKVEGGAEIKAALDRIAELEKKANRPNPGKNDTDEQRDIEKRRWPRFCVLATLAQSPMLAAPSKPSLQRRAIMTLRADGLFSRPWTCRSECY
ncbi:hypothetical protein P7F60_04935 [Rhizobium sp. YJ-22]|uniref:hypothetical protein n=1 Tax=Rhizobium sp. YJ-22 TaxID=3037556 RepID=UPI0024129C87|nr:hypothetical protein [Rhizobium sp. YJ-22]MDG3575720.1 hypothetical protein [Rhizobium sp. YJ-22]